MLRGSSRFCNPWAVTGDPLPPFSPTRIFHRNRQLNGKSAPPTVTAAIQNGVYINNRDSSVFLTEECDARDRAPNKAVAQNTELWYTFCKSLEEIHKLSSCTTQKGVII